MANPRRRWTIRKKWDASALLFLAPIVVAAAAPTPYRIADFEGAHALAGWRSAEGTLATTAGHRGQGAVLTYRLTCCGTHAAAIWTPPQSPPKLRDPAIWLWLRHPADVQLTLTARDSSGVTLRFPIAATLETAGSADWRHAAVPLPGIKGKLAEIALLVEPRARTSVAGAVAFDDLELHENSAPFRFDPRAATTVPPASAISVANLGVNIHRLQDDHSLDLAHAAGFGFVRADLLWVNVERNGRYRFFAYDALLGALEARGMGVLWILDYGHPDHGGKTPQTSDDVAAFGRFAAAAAAHFKGHNARYEIWNEPNIPQFWPPAPNPAAYAALLREAVAAIHSADPDAQIASGGVSHIDEAFLSRAIQPDIAAHLTAIGIHPYPEGAPERIAAPIDALTYGIRQAFGDRLELWDTEWGYASESHSEAARQRQAVLAIRELLTVWALGLPQAVWYDLRDDGADAANPEQNYGLLDSDGNEKAAMRAVRNLLAAAGSRKFTGMLAEIPAGLHGMRFEGASDTLAVVWRDEAGRATLEYPRENLVSATDLLGRPLKSMDKAGMARLAIDGNAGPIYLVWSARP